MMGKKLPKRIIDKIRSLRKEGYKISYICEKLNINKNTVVKYSKTDE